ncbi:MAG: hypothetical protein H0U18_02540 [Pyrinomonadaceae bacterium]|nr:hypothetical protein [Pyrinomonadaceae bacterium]
MKFAIAVLVISLSGLSVLAQGPPTLRIVTEVPSLPSELFYGDIRVKPLRLRPGTNTPITINDADFFVHQQYVDFLSRMPDQSGFNFWVNQITSCGGNGACVDGQRVNSSGAFFLSIEFNGTGYFVYRLHKGSFGDLPRYATFMPDTRQVGNGVIVGQGDWQGQLAANQTAFANAWVGRGSFLARYPTTLSPGEYVDNLIQAAGLTAAQVNRNQIVADLTASGNSTAGRATALRSIIESSAFDTKEKSPAFVLMQYFGYLRRNPDGAPDNNLDGYNFWLNKLNQFNGDFHAAEMVKSFIVSGEYFGRF